MTTDRTMTIAGEDRVVDMGKLMQTRIKASGALLDYTLDWSRWLGRDETGTLVDTIVSSDFEIAGPTNSVEGLQFPVTPAKSNTPSTTTVWLDKGVDGEAYVVTNSIVTTAGRKTSRTFKVFIQESQ